MDPALRELLRTAAGTDRREVEAIIRLADPAHEPPGVRIVARFGTVATCRLAPGSVESAWRDDGVLSIKAARPLGSQAVAQIEAPAAVKPILPADRRRPDTALTGAGVLVGVVDWGCDFAHPNLLTDRGATRLRAIWDQRPSGVGAPAPYGYGVVHEADEIDAALRTGSPYRALGYHPADADRDGSGAHGTHVLDIAAGNGQVGGPVGIAPGADLVFVHLADRGTGGLATLGDSVRLLEAVDFVLGRAGSQPCVINISVGRHGGPHDGHTLVELALEEAVRAAPGRCLVHSAGNYLDKGVHASGRLDAGQTRVLSFITRAGDLTPNELEVWYGGAAEFRVMLRAPTGEQTAWVGLDEHADVIAGDVQVGRMYHRARDPNNGDHHVDVFLGTRAPVGRWAIVLHALDAADTPFHAWIERDEACARCQARFAPADTDSSSTIGTIANGRLPLVVGAFDPHSATRARAPFSSEGPTRDGRRKPDVLAPGKQVLAARSAPPDANANPGLLTRKTGSSMAAPHVTGLVALCMQRAGRPLTIEEIRTLVVGAADPGGRVDPVKTLVAASSAPLFGSESETRPWAGDVSPEDMVEDDAPPPRPPFEPGPIDVRRAVQEGGLSCRPTYLGSPKSRTANGVPPRRNPTFERGDDPGPVGVVGGRAPAVNVIFWKALGLDAVRPLADLLPSRHPWAFANRVAAAQGLLRRAGKTRLAVDGMLGPATYTALYDLARGTSGGVLLRAAVAASGVDLDAIAKAPAVGGLARRRALPGRIVDRMTVGVPAPVVLNFYERRHRKDVDAEQWSDHYLAVVNNLRHVDALTWPERIAILRALHGTEQMRVEAALVQVERAVVEEDAHRLIEPRNVPAIGWAFRHEPRSEDLSDLGMDFTRRDSGRAAIAAAKRARARAPQTLLKAFHPVVQTEGLVAAQQYLDERHAKRERAGAERILASLDALRLSTSAIEKLPAYLQQRRREEAAIDALGPFLGTDDAQLKLAFDALAKANRLDEFFGAAAAFSTYDRRELVAELVRRLPKVYSEHPAAVRFMQRHKQRTESERRHVYDPSGRITLEEGRGVVVADDKPTKSSVVGAVNGAYHRTDTVPWIRPERMKQLCDQWAKETAIALDAIVMGTAPDGVSSEDLLRTTWEAATKNVRPAFTPAEVRPRQMAVSLHVKAIEAVDPSGTRFRICCRLVHSFDGKEWLPLEPLRWRSQADFEEELDWFYFNQLMAATATIVEGITLTAAAVGAVFAIAAAPALLGSVIVSELVMIVTKLVHGEAITMEDFIGAAFDGLLGLLAFRLIGPIAGRLTGSITRQTLLGRVQAFVASGLIVEAGGGAVTGPVSLFFRDVYRVIREGGGFSNWNQYLDAASAGGCDGATLGLLGRTGPRGAVASLVLGVARKGPCGGSGQIAGEATAAEGGGRPRGTPKAPRSIAEKTAAELHAAGASAPQTAAYFASALSGARENFGRVFSETQAGRRLADEATRALRERTERIVKAVPGGDAGAAAALSLPGLARSADATTGLERLLAHRLRNFASYDPVLATLLSHPRAAAPVLSLLGAIDDTTFKSLQPDALRRMTESPAVHALLTEAPEGTVARMFQTDLNGSARALEHFATELQALPEPRRAQVHAAIRDHGGFLRATDVIAFAKRGWDLTPETLVGMERVTALIGRNDVRLIDVGDPAAGAARLRGVAEGDLANAVRSLTALLEDHRQTLAASPQGTPQQRRDRAAALARLDAARVRLRRVGELHSGLLARPSPASLAEARRILASRDTSSLRSLEAARDALAHFIDVAAGAKKAWRAQQELSIEHQRAILVRLEALRKAAGVPPQWTNAWLGAIAEAYLGPNGGTGQQKIPNRVHGGHSKLDDHWEKGKAPAGLPRERVWLEIKANRIDDDHAVSIAGQHAREARQDWDGLKAIPEHANDAVVISYLFAPPPHARQQVLDALFARESPIQAVRFGVEPWIPRPAGIPMPVPTPPR